MATPAKAADVIRFGVFEVDLRSAELRRQGVKIKLQERPFQVLSILLREPGRTVSRDELRQTLWASDTFVDFDHGISSAVNKLRDALDDSAVNPKFIETVGRRGYRFIAPLGAAFPSGPQSVIVEGPPTAEAVLRKAPRSRRFEVLFFLGVVASAIGIFVLHSVSRTQPPRVVRMVQLTNSGRAEHFGGLHTDGSRLYFVERSGARWILMQTSFAGGEVVPVAVPFPNTLMFAISPDRSEMLFSTASDFLSKHALWTMPLQGGTPRRVGDIMVDEAIWFPDGRRLLCSLDREVFSVERDGTDRRHLFEVDGHPFRFAWKPDGASFRFGVQSNGTAAQWEASAAGTNVHPVLPGWNPVPNEWRGSWTADGKNYVFDSIQRGQQDLWVLREPGIWPWAAKPKPVRLTDGPTSFSEPLVSADGKKVFALGMQARGYVARFDTKQREYVPSSLPSNAFDLAFSRDGNWVAYTEQPNLTLWRSRIDGSERLQLTTSPMRALRPRWSPDGKLVLFVGQELHKYQSAYTVSTDGGVPQAVMQNDRLNREYADWLPGGGSVVLGVEHGMYPDAGITLVDLRTHQNSEVPGSRGMRVPRFSPAGEYLAATSEDVKGLFLFDSVSRQWTQVAKASQVWKFEWDRDGSYLYYQDIRDPGQAVFRLDPKTAKTERVLDFTKLLRDGAMRCSFEGRAPDGSFMVSVASSWADLYAFDVELH